MEDVKTMITDIKGKLDELESELLQLENKAVGQHWVKKPNPQFPTSPIYAASRQTYG